MTFQNETRSSSVKDFLMLILGLFDLVFCKNRIPSIFYATNINIDFLFKESNMMFVGGLIVAIAVEHCRQDYHMKVNKGKRTMIDFKDHFQRTNNKQMFFFIKIRFTLLRSES